MVLSMTGFAAKPFPPTKPKFQPKLFFPPILREATTHLANRVTEDFRGFSLNDEHYDVYNVHGFYGWDEHAALAQKYLKTNY